MTTTRRRAAAVSGFLASCAAFIAAAQDHIPGWMPSALTLAALILSALILCWPRRIGPVAWACAMLAGRESRRKLRFIHAAQRHASRITDRGYLP
jgi:hypothetical protein